MPCAIVLWVSSCHWIFLGATALFFPCPLLIHLKTSENVWFSDVFRGIKKEHLEEKPSTCWYYTITRKGEKLWRKIKDQLTFHQIYQNFMENFFLCKIQSFFETIFSKYQGRFRKGSGPQQCFLAILGKWKKSRWQRQNFRCFTNIMNKDLYYLPGTDP